MPKVSFKYDYKKDAWAWVFIAKDTQTKWGVDWSKRVNFMPQYLLDKVLENDHKKAIVLVYKYILSNPKKKIYQIAIKEQLKAVENIWRKIEKEYFKRLAKITQKPIYWNNFKCYLTTGQMCPLNTEQKSFTISKWAPISANVTTVCHEIFHLQFLHYYDDYCRKFLSFEQVDALKEIITFIINTDFGDITPSWDMGYPGHKELREKLKVIWEKDKNFQRFLDKAIKIVKNKDYGT